MISVESVFVDTSAWVALADSDDSYHSKASKIYPRLLKESKNLVTSNFIIAETYILILKTIGRKAALNFLESISASPRILIIYSNHGLENEAINILNKFNDHNFSYTDAVSFAMMQHQGIKKAFSFDKHFVVAGFENTF